MSEKIYLEADGVRVTSQRITVRGPTYFTANISGVDVTRHENMPVYLLLTVAAMWCFFGFGVGSYSHGIGAALVIGTLLKWAPLRLYYLVLDTNSGRVQALRGQKNALLDLKETIETAITEKDRSR
jgi:hypothetical protein